MLPKITIITVVYNAVSTLEETILSVINQNFDNFEYIIIDGGSTDGTVEIIKKYQDNITLWISEPDKGIYDAMNKGIQNAKGEYVYFLGADDVLIDEFVLEKVKVLFTNKFNIYYGNVIFKNRNQLYDGKFNAFKLVTRNISHQSIFYPKAVFDEFQYNTVYRIFADYELNLKLFNHKEFQFQFIPITIALFNDYGVSGTITIDANFEADRLSIIKANFNYLVYLYRVFRTKFALLLRRK
jgi:glycosyltransferase involved in cell wall biosynthesis